MAYRILFAVVLLSLSAVVSADTPANCSYEDIQGSWVIHEAERGHDNTLKGCDSTSLDYITKRQIKLSFPATAVDEYGNEGYWTLIYNQGFEIVITGRKYFMFSKYVSKLVSMCNETQEGWSHTVTGADWACVKGVKVNSAAAGSSTVRYKSNVMNFYKNIGADKNQLYKFNKKFIDDINSVQKSWQATRYEQFESLTLNDLHRMAGGSKSKIAGIPHPKRPSGLTAAQLKQLPEKFDWRTARGPDMISPVRNQGQCGSCYAFASLGMNQDRRRIMTNGTEKLTFSTQDVVECCEYSQGCEGGFPYLVGGKYAADFGLVDESCNPYSGKDGNCSTKANCPRNYAYNYRYVGGYYGACNEEEMKRALVSHGPLAVSFEVYSDFMLYKGGVYHHVEGLEDGFNPFEITNHAVLLVGYGVDPVGGPFWTIKNSWGTSWGEEGYFRIRRGVDECSIESIAVESFPVL